MLYRGTRPFAFGLLIVLSALALAAGAIPSVAMRILARRDLLIWELPSARLSLQPDGLAWQDGTTISLPDAWDRSRPAFGGKARYTFTVTLSPAEANDRALYIPRVSNSCVILINGKALSLADNGPIPTWRWNRPLYRLVPADMLRPGQNEITVEVNGLRNSRAGLSESYFGPRDLLYSAYRLRSFFQIELLWVANVSAIVLAIPLLFSWIRDRQGSRTYGLFGAGSMLFGIRNFHGFANFLPMPVEIWWPLVSASLGWSLVFMYSFLLRISGHFWPRFERALVVFAGLGSILLFITPTVRFMSWSPWIWYLPLLLTGLFCVGAFTRQAFANPTPQSAVLLFGILAQIGPAVHDVLWIAGIGSFSSILWMALSYPLTLILMSVVLADDMAKTRAALGSMNSVLETRVAEARRDLEWVYESRRAAERDAAGMEERLRLMRDMHDGVGTRLSLLLSGLARSEISHSEVENAVRASLDELHLLLDARGPGTTTLVDALGNLRYRLGPRLSAIGVETRWEFDATAEALVLSAEATLNVLRIVQECISNAVRHGQARLITLSVASSMAKAPERAGGDNSMLFEVRVADNGVGLGNASAATRGGGHGTANIHARADALEATFTLTSSESGTVALLRLPPSSR